MRLPAVAPAAALIVPALLLSCAPRPEPADLVLLGGRIVTMDRARPEARALAARAGRIVAVGSDDEVARFVGPSTTTVRLEGRLAIPGFIEGHGHFTSLGRALGNLDLRSARTWDEVVARVAEEAKRRPAGSWIFGWGWHQDKWDRPAEPSVEGYPVHDALTRAVPDHPVVLKHASGGHMGIVNARAMEIARIGPATPDPPGGRIVRDRAGRPTGVLRETAFDIAQHAYDAALAARSPDAVERDALEEIRRATEACLRAGVTSFQDGHATFDEIDRFRRVADRGELGVRLWIMVMEPNDVLRARLRGYAWKGLDDEHLTVGAIKKQIDGALGSRGAWLLAPYADEPDTSGLNTQSIAEIEEAARIALEHHLQICVHAIGDRANRETLDLYERVLRDNGLSAAPRWRIEHAQHLDPADVPRFAKLGVIAAMQSIHCVSDGAWVPARIGEERARLGAYVWRKLLDSGAVVSNGTDTPVEDVDPIPNFHAAVTRRMADGRLFFPEQCMTREEALRSLTLSAAYAAREEDVKGSLAPGKLADVAVLSKDILEAPEDEIRDARVDLTILGGRVVYERPR